MLTYKTEIIALWGSFRETLHTLIKYISTVIMSALTLKTKCQWVSELFKSSVGVSVNEYREALVIVFKDMEITLHGTWTWCIGCKRIESVQIIQMFSPVDCPDYIMLPQVLMQMLSSKTKALHPPVKTVLLLLHSTSIVPRVFPTLHNTFL